jgi:predicted RNase H-like HicB family nuclease
MPQCWQQEFEGVLMDHIMKHYRIGWPGWKVIARTRIPLSFRVHVNRDQEANVYWATSPDIDGLVVEGQTLEELMREVMGAADSLVEMQLGQSRPADPIVEFHGAFCAA